MPLLSTNINEWPFLMRPMYGSCSKYKFWGEALYSAGSGRLSASFGVNIARCDKAASMVVFINKDHDLTVMATGAQNVVHGCKRSLKERRRRSSCISNIKSPVISRRCVALNQPILRQHANHLLETCCAISSEINRWKKWSRNWKIGFIFIWNLQIK